MRIKSISGLLLVAAGILQLGIGGLVMAQSIDAGQQAEILEARNDNNCIASLGQIGAVNEIGEIVEVRMAEFGHWRSAMEQTSALISYCNTTRYLSYFCIGSSCDGKTPAAIGARPDEPTVHFILTKRA